MITSEMLTSLQLNQRHADSIVQRVPGGMANVQDVHPLSPLQEGILFHRLLSEKSDSYVLSVLFESRTRVQVDALIDALQNIINRHESLRSAVLWEGLPRPVHVVYHRAALPVEERTLDPDRDAHAQLHERMQPRQPRFNLRRAPLLRLEVAPDPHSARWFVVLQVHHLVCDHQSLQIIVAEAIAFLEERESDLPTVLPFRQHITRVFADIRSDDAEAFFRSKLADVDEPTAPFGLLDVHGDGSQIEEARQALDPVLSEGIRTQARRYGVSAARLFHAAWALVVARTSGRSDVVFGTVLLTGQQTAAPARRTVGMFVNTLPIRFRLQDLTVAQLVEQTHREIQELRSHEQTSLALAQRCSGTDGSAPLFTAILNYRHNAPQPLSQQSSARGVRVLAKSEAWTNYPITLTVDNTAAGFVLMAHTDRRIDPRRVTGYLTAAMQSLVSSLEHVPQTRVLTLPILPQNERRQLLELFNATQAPHPAEKMIHELFEEQVQVAPTAMAVSHDGDSLSYAALNGRANQLARYLQEKGVEPDRIVGLCVERSLDMVVGLLAILKAGGAYLPLDPNYPSERLQFMLQDANPRVVLTHERLRAVLGEKTAEVIALDTIGRELIAYQPQNLAGADIGLTARNLLYAIYTSGSTGRPKCTGMPHRAMVNLIEWHRRTLRGSDRPRVLQFAALSFDVAFQEIFSTLCTGGTLVLLDEWVRRDARLLCDLLTQQRIERMFVPPLMLQSLAQYSMTTLAVPAMLKDIITAGEQLRITPEIVNFFKQLDGCRLHNHYGPTETHVVTALTLSDGPDEWPILPSIGRPVANTQIYVLDEQQQPVPLGVTGEIYIGGANVAREYLNRPELTAARFITDPFAADSRARMYRTGDLGRWCADGTIEYLGRNDDQVKIRGFRIELGEIEARLVLHPQVKQAAIAAREEATGAKRLIAYVTSHGDEAPSAEALRAYLKQGLPEHMVPSAFVVLERLPLTPSGKLNRRALPAPDLRDEVCRDNELPRGEVESMLAQIWQELLGIAHVGREESFFDLGGHSLLAMQVASRIQEAFAIYIPIRALFEHATLQGLAACVEELRRAQLLASAADGELEVDEMLDTLTSMPESRVRELLRTFTIGR